MNKISPMTKAPPLHAGCAMLSVDDMLNIACYELVGIDMSPVTFNHQRAIALITDHQIERFAKLKSELIDNNPPHLQQQMRAHFLKLPERLKVWRDRAKLAIN